MNRRPLMHALWMVLFLVSLAVPAAAQLDERCTVSVLNRSTQVQPDGSWVLPNVPANVGMVRARATCVENGRTRAGQSDYFVIPANGVVEDVDIVFDQPEPIAASLLLEVPTRVLDRVGATVQVVTRGVYANGVTVDITASENGTNYFTSNARIASIDANGMVTAHATGTALISAMNEGALGMLQLTVLTSGDSDGDGLPDDWENSNGLNPANPADAQLDLDADGLSNLEEFRNGTDVRDADSDDDNLADGEEVNAGSDGYITNPLLADTDGDGIRDGLEVSTGSDPTNAASYNLAAALSSISVAPPSATLIVNTIVGEAYTQLAVTGRLRDGTSLDLTSTGRGTNYTSSDLTICNFGAPDGRVFAGLEGRCTITIVNGGHAAAVPITVRNFSPVALSSLAISGHANSVDVRNGYAFIAAGAAGLVIVDVRNPLAPVVAATRDTPGNANDVRVVGDYAYVADGSSGLQIINVANRTAPAIVSSVATGGDARDLAVSGNAVYVAAGSAGLVVVNAATPGAPILVGSYRTPSAASGIDLAGTYAVVVDGASLRVVDVANAAAPALVGSVSLPATPNDLRVVGRVAYVACYSSGVRVVDFSTATAPRIVGSLPGSAPSGFIPLDVAAAGNFLLAAEVLFVNAVTIVEITNPASPVMRGLIDFSRFSDHNGNGIAVDGAFTYMTGSTSLSDRGSSGNTRLFIGQYLPLEDHAGNAPTISLTAPAPDSTHIEDDTITVSADASDDVAVAGVTFQVDGADVFTDTSFPYEHSLVVPTGVSAATLGAAATDLGGNIATAVPVAIRIIPDPLTTVTGIVVDNEGAPIAGAAVTTNGDRTAVTGSNGRFTLTGVTTIRGNIIVNARATAADGTLLTGASASLVPVRGGTTDVGTIVAIAAAWEPNYGTFITTCDDCSFSRTLPFAFPFYGSSRTQLFVGTNGYITFSSGDNTYTESLPAFNSQPRIAAFFDDLIGGGGLWVNDQLPGRFVVTYVENRHYSEGGSNTLQMTLYSDGRILFAYRGITALRTGTIVGLTPGPNSPPQQVDYSASTLFDVAPGHAVFEYFTSTSQFDLDGAFVIYSPSTGGGYQVRTILQPPSAQSAQVTNDGSSAVLNGRVATTSAGSGNGRFARAEVEVRSSRNPHFRAVVNTDKNGVFTVRKVPVGGVSITVRRKDLILGYGAAVVAAESASRVQRIDITPPAPEKTEPRSE